MSWKDSEHFIVKVTKDDLRVVWLTTNEFIVRGKRHATYLVILSFKNLNIVKYHFSFLDIDFP